MKKLNIDVNNRIYTVFDIWFNGTVEEVERLERMFLCTRDIYAIIKNEQMFA